MELINIGTSQFTYGHIRWVLDCGDVPFLVRLPYMTETTRRHFQGQNDELGLEARYNSSSICNNSSRWWTKSSIATKSSADIPYVVNKVFLFPRWCITYQRVWEIHVVNWQITNAYQKPIKHLFVWNPYCWCNDQNVFHSLLEYSLMEQDEISLLRSKKLCWKLACHINCSAQNLSHILKRLNAIGIVSTMLRPKNKD